jgi:hypothetical protein
MATRNDITGDALVSRTSLGYINNYDLIRDTQEEVKVFEVFDCKRCHIKVSTSNKKCPCCGEDLPNG